MAEFFEEGDEGMEGIVFGVTVEGGEEAGVEGGDVEVEDIFEDAAFVGFGEAAWEFFDIGGEGGEALVVMEVFFEEEEFDFMGVTAEGGFLEGDGEVLGLGEVGGEEEVGEFFGFAEVVFEVGEELVFIFGEGVLNLVCFEVGTFVDIGGDAEGAGDGFEAIGGEFAFSDVVDLDEEVGIDDGAAWDCEFWEVEPAFCDFEFTFFEGSVLVEAAPEWGDVEFFEAGVEVMEVEVEDIVAFEGIWVEFLEGLVEVLEEGTFAVIGEVF